MKPCSWAKKSVENSRQRHRKTGNWLGQVLWDGHKPSEGEASSVPTSLEKKKHTDSLSMLIKSVFRLRVTERERRDALTLLIV